MTLSIAGSLRLHSPGRKLAILVIAAMATLLVGCDGNGGIY